jgi:hypothetical protein
MLVKHRRFANNAPAERNRRRACQNHKTHYSPSRSVTTLPQLIGVHMRITNHGGIYAISPETSDEDARLSDLSAQRASVEITKSTFEITNHSHPSALDHSEAAGGLSHTSCHSDRYYYSED